MNKQGKSTRRTEAAEASKQAILDAAETVFAEKGYDAASLQEICDLAGVTRGLPNYFFGSKEGLYRAVLARTFTHAQELVTFIHEQAHAPGVNAQEILRVVIERLFDDLTTHPTFVRLTEWEALHGARYLGNLPSQFQLLREAIHALQEDLGWQGDAEQFLIALTALCWFPTAHAETFLRPLGVNVHDPNFHARYKQHVVHLLLGDIPDHPNTD
ncbi:TetR family transcriptional regulator [Ktedonobacter sp. SOSP1-85]|uniref:TetR/AcrR family transcriptional regulator n=1 Tax=Ktedonobacter sp. SOSP1-85 TaxID=2778367 RepID=UPI001916084E|nr:TetR/AcrR family transcriptional regulator [Ktedonobacter sp. SOSP1-85]GHO80511.1 TetR family transcriptional regulator [Ktedonobacter sp. SOSP1-85]